MHTYSYYNFEDHILDSESNIGLNTITESKCFTKD